MAAANFSTKGRVALTLELVICFRSNFRSKFENLFFLYFNFIFFLSSCQQDDFSGMEIKGDEPYEF